MPPQDRSEQGGLTPIEENGAIGGEPDADSNQTESIQATADAIAEGVTVAGTGELAPTVRERAATSDVARAAAHSHTPHPAGALIVAIDGDDKIPAGLAGRAGFVVGILAVPDSGLDGVVLGAARTAVDVVVLVPDTLGDVEAATSISTEDAAVAGTFVFARMLRDPGAVNLDLADARTVLSSQPLGVLCHGVAEADPQTAVGDAFERLPGSVDPTAASGALVSVAGPAETTLSEVVAAVRAVREVIGEQAHIIWGSARGTDRISVRLVLAGPVRGYPLVAGDPCPRCESPLASFELGDSQTLTCEGCGFADLSMTLE